MNNQKTQTISSDWLKYIQEAESLAFQKGTLLAQDSNATPIILEWETIDSQSSHLTEKIKNFSEILIETYINQEIQFAQKHPEAVAHEYFLKSLAPLFQAEKTNLYQAKEQLKTIFHQFFAATDFGKFCNASDVHIFVVAQDAQTKIPLGLIQFLITAEFPYGTVKAGYFGILSKAHNRGIDKLLMSSIFKLLPNITRIFLHTRVTNEDALKLYASWGFNEVPGKLAYWTDKEYKTERSDILQKAADILVY